MKAKIVICGFFAAVLFALTVLGEDDVVDEEPSVRGDLIAAMSANVVVDAPACPLGSVLWSRSLDVRFCAATCASDIDCDLDARCRLVDEEANADPDIVLADDEPLLAEARAGVCDPFFDVVGSLSSAEQTQPHYSSLGAVSPA